MTTSMKTYVAFLRGINVGGHKKVPMQDLRDMLEALGYVDVKTVLASGNAIFKASGSEDKILKDMDASMRDTFGFQAAITLVDSEIIQNILKDNPFPKKELPKGTKAYVTFLGTEAAGKEFKCADFELLGRKHNCAFSLVDTTQKRSVDFVKCLDDSFGKGVTTRTLKTLEKIQKQC